MISIRTEIEAIADGTSDRTDNPLRNAPHTAADITSTTWRHPYTRERAAFPIATTSKYWPPVNRVDNAYGDRNLACTCPPIESYAEAAE